jgi:hypothetical protein
MIYTGTATLNKTDLLKRDSNSDLILTSNISHLCADIKLIRVKK